ncbi:hypothetical protein MKW94_010979 [Papaver nudicaule]|uniref:At1g61320/AtMIF1 LRR domain-containing protein n=1 Tax=Papaver nudicaule TaxID=74823 RepID=A0AA41RZT1_PAPNU|nr:hypothetical protein [Papaver nudicaule]
MTMHGLCLDVFSHTNLFTSVKAVKFTRVQLQRDSVYDFVSKCPCLEDLHLIDCQIPSSSFELIAPESNLKCLVVQYCDGNGGFEHAYIHIPTLLQLKFVGSFTTGYLSIYNSENLMEAEIDILYCPSNKHKLLCKLLNDVHNVKSLTLYSSNLEVLNTNGGISLPTPFNNLMHLIVKLGQADGELLGLMCLLRNSPCLETLSIDFHRRICEIEDEILSAVYNVDERAVLGPHLLPSECIAHLIEIKIENFLGVKAEMEFVRLILLSSLGLKEMVMCIRSIYNFLKHVMGEEHHTTLKKKKADTIESLLACTRASPYAKILLK